MVSQRRDSRVWSVHGTTEPGPPVTSGTVGGSSCATSAPTPALPRIVFAAATAPQPDAGERGAWPRTDRSCGDRPGDPPRTLAAPRATVPESLDSPLATANSTAVTARLEPRALGMDTSRTTFSRASVSPGASAPRVAVPGPGEQVRADRGGQCGRHPGGVEAGLAARRLEAVGADAGQPRRRRARRRRDGSALAWSSRARAGGTAFIIAAPTTAAAASTMSPDAA